MLLASGSAAEVTYRPPVVDPLAVAMMDGFARCVADTDETGARRVLAADFHAPSYGRMVRAFAIGHSSCLRGGRLQFNQVVLVGGMAEELTRRSGVSETTVATAAAADRSDSPARCLVRRDTAGVWALFATPPASRREDVAVSALRPAYVACSPSGQVPIFNNVSLRAGLALAVYRLLDDRPLEG